MTPPPVASQVSSSTGTEPWVMIVLALISATVSLVGVVFAYRAATHAKQANDAVNHRHLLGVDSSGQPTTPRLFDLAVETHASVATLTSRVERLDESNAAQHGALARIVARHTARLDRHERATDEVAGRLDRHERAAGEVVGRLDTLTHRLLVLEDRRRHPDGPVFTEDEEGATA